MWCTLFADFPDTLLVDHLEFGWPLDYTALSITSPASSNHTPAADLDVHIASYIKKELDFGAMLGPFDAPSFTPGPRKNSTSKRVIIYLSFPHSSPSIRIS